MFVKYAWTLTLLAALAGQAHAEGQTVVVDAAAAQLAAADTGAGTVIGTGTGSGMGMQARPQVLSAQLNAYLDGKVLLASSDAVTLAPVPSADLSFNAAAQNSCDALTRFIGSCDYVGSAGADEPLFSALLPSGLPAKQDGPLSPIDESVSFIAAAVPIPAAGLLFGTALLGAVFIRRKKLQHKLGLPS